MEALKSVGKSSLAYLFVLTLESLLMLTLSSVALAVDSDKWVKNTCIIALVASVWFVYFAWDSILFECVFQFWSSLLMSGIITTFAVWHYFNDDGLGQVYHQASLAVAVIAGLFQVGYLLLAPWVHSSFGWQSYHAVGSSLPLQEMYRQFKKFQSFLKLDFALSILLVISSALFLLTSSVEIAMNGAAVFVSFFWAVALNQAVFYERINIVRGLMLFALLEPAYIALKLYQMSSSADHTDLNLDLPPQTRAQFWVSGESRT